MSIEEKDLKEEFMKEIEETSWFDEELRDARNILAHCTFLSDETRKLVYNLKKHPYPKTHLLLHKI
jgi:hypothetical protein